MSEEEFHDLGFGSASYLAGWLNNSGNPIVPPFQPGSLTLGRVPAPSAALVFAGGLPLLGLALRRRR